MLFKTTLVKSITLSFSSKITIVYNENLEFCLTPQNSGNNNYIFQIHDFKGEFEIQRIVVNGTDIPYDKENKTFVTTSQNAEKKFDFYILTDIEYKKVAYQYVQYDFKFPGNRSKLLKLYEYYEEYFTLPEYEHIKFKYFVKKISGAEVEVCIEIPPKIDIYDVNKSAIVKVESFKYEASSVSDINIWLYFVFDPSDHREEKQCVSQMLTGNNNALYEIMSNTDFADVVITSSKKF